MAAKSKHASGSTKQKKKTADKSKELFKPRAFNKPGSLNAKTVFTGNKRGRSLKDKENTTLLKDESSCNLDEAYQQLLTKYFKAKRKIKKLKHQTEFDQRKISLLEFSRQQESLQLQLQAANEPEALLEVPEQDSEQEKMDSCKNDCSVGREMVVSPENETSQIVCTQQENSLSFEKILESIDKMDEEIGSEKEQLSPVASLPEIKNDIVKRIADVISEESLRPVVFKVSSESPPGKMHTILDKLTHSGLFCEGCGRRMEKRQKLLV